MHTLATFALLAALAGTPAEAGLPPDPPPPAAVDPPPGPGLLLGERYRYPRLVLPLRFAADLVAIPASVARWETRDFEILALYTGAVAALMTPSTPSPALSPDARLQRWVNQTLGPDRFRIWTRTGDMLVWTGIWTVASSTLLYSWLAGDPALAESFSLMLEAFGVAQIYQVGIKLILGREGPNDGDARGLMHGPAGFFRLFPAGTPSGHAASLYAMIGAVSAYWNLPWLEVAMQTFGLAFCVSVVTDNYHFISDVVWGAAMGYYLGRWVVRHRSTRYRYEKDALVPVAVAPLIAPASGTYGLSLTWRF